MASWLKVLVNAHGEPAFVAVEMDVGIRHLLNPKREAFRSIAGGLFGSGGDAAVIDALAKTMAWEVDAHRAVLPNHDPVYLDHPDKPRSGAINGIASFNSFRGELSDFNGDRSSVTEVTTHLSSKAQTRATTAAIPHYPEIREDQKARERDFLSSIRRELRMAGWGLLVVGALHASRYDNDTFRMLLDREGHHITVKYLTWQPPANIA